MARGNSTGCGVAVIVALVVAVVVIAGAGLLMFYSKASIEDEGWAEIHGQEPVGMGTAEDDDTNRVSLIRGKEPRLGKYRRGETLSRELYLAAVLDQSATQLAKQTFRDEVEGARIKWLVKTVEIKNQGGEIVGDFSLPYVITSPDHEGTTSGPAQLRARFDESSRADLLDVKRGEWITLTGRLSMVAEPDEILDPRRVVAGANPETP